MLSSLYTWTRGSSLKLWVLEGIFFSFSWMCCFNKEANFHTFFMSTCCFLQMDQHSGKLSGLKPRNQALLTVKNDNLILSPLFSKALFIAKSPLSLWEHVSVITFPHSCAGRNQAGASMMCYKHQSPLAIMSELICDKASWHSISWGGCEDYLWWLVFSTENSADGE